MDFSGVAVLDPHLHSDFHRRVENPVYAGLQDDHVADADRIQKADVVHRCSYYRLSCVPPCRESATKIDQVHDVAPQHVANNIRIIWQRNLRVLGARFADGTTFERRVIHKCFLVVAEAQRPWNLGPRFSRKADVPSFLSWVAAQIATSDLSITNPSAWFEDGFRARNELLRGHNLVDKTNAIRFLSTDHSSGKDELQGQAFSNQPRQALSPPEARDNSQFHFRLADFRAVRSQSDGTSHGCLAAPSQGKPVDGSDHRLPQVLD